MRLKIIVLVPLLLFGCKKNKDSADPSPIPSPVNVAGVWNGSLGSSTAPTRALVLTLAQTGGSMTGTFNINAGGATGTVSGSVSRNTLTFTATQTTPCAGSFTGDADVSGNAMDGTLVGTSICGGAFNGAFFVDR